MKREQNWRTWETAGMLVTLLLGNGLHFSTTGRGRRAGPRISLR